MPPASGVQALTAMWISDDDDDASADIDFFASGASTLLMMEPVISIRCGTSPSRRAGAAASAHIGGGSGTLGIGCAAISRGALRGAFEPAIRAAGAVSA